MERPIAKISSAIVIIGSAASVLFMNYNNVMIEPEVLAFISGLASAAATFLFMSEKK